MTGSAFRPTGVTALAVLAAISGALSLVTGIGFVAGAPLIAEVAVGTVASDLAGPLKSVAIVIGIGWLAVGAAQLAFAYGAWTLKPWGWMLGLVIEGSSIVLTLIVGVMSGSLVGTLVASIVPLAVAIVIIAYLLSPTVKSAFGRA